ncbi:CBM35 domain-containing protein [Kribbella sp. NPDC049584]|uniref:CBM35 domain-containing protein n=1 Tax=Kribbella sp. NPDC049584 TaxID=3154833 RepID=UPI003425EA2A
MSPSPGHLSNGVRRVGTVAATAQTRRLRRRKGIATLGALLIAAALLVGAQKPASADAAVEAASAKQLSVDLSAKTKRSAGVGLGILYGVTQDGLQPSDQFIDPLKLNAFRSGGWYSGGWIKDQFTFGAATQANIDAVIAEAKRLQQPPRHKFEYQVLLSDVFGSTGGAPASTLWPCTNGDCSNWISFIDATVTQLQASDQEFTYEIWNEPDLSIFWKPGVNTAQYFQMWDSAYREIRRLAPDAKIAGPSFAFTPERRPDEWQTFLAHAKAAGTVPDEITNHDEGDIDDPVTVGQSLADALDANGISQRPLSANEYQPADRQTAGDTAWYDARLAQSNYANAMRGNWICCTIPNLTGLLTKTPAGWAPNGNWWAMRTYADLTGTLVSTSEQVGSTAISASEDPAEKRAVALIGDIQGGYVGPMAVNFTGLSSTPWLVRDGRVHATVYRIPDQGPLFARQVVFSQDVAVDGDAVAVPFDFQSKHDAYGVYLSSAEPQEVSLEAPSAVQAGSSYTVPVTFTNGGDQVDRKVQTGLAVYTAAGEPAPGFNITCGGTDAAACASVPSLGAGQSVVAQYTVTTSADLAKGNYRFTATAAAKSGGQDISVQNSSDVLQQCGIGDVCEAEDGTLAGGACLATDHPGYTGSGFAACFTTPGGSVTQRIMTQSAGTYTLDLRYAAGPNGPAGTRSASVSVNGGASQQIPLPLTGSWNTWGDATIPVNLQSGSNTIAVLYTPTDAGWFNLDHLVVTQ